MSTSPAEAFQDQEHFTCGHEVELGCLECGERWVVLIGDGEFVTDRQAECHCGGSGEEV